MPGQAIVTIRDKPWQAYLATTYAELTTGLRGLPAILPGTGMLFVFPQDRAVTVTTQGVNFPIDIIFVSSQLEVVSVARGVMPNVLVTESTSVKYFLEVNAGEAVSIESGDSVSIAVIQAVAGNTDWISPVVSFAGVVMVGAMMVKMGKTMADAVFGKPKERPLIYGPGGEPRLPQTGKQAVGKYEIGTDRMGNIIITRTDDPGKDVFLQFESDKALVYELLKKGERKDLDAGWSVTIKRSEPRASILDESWESSAQPQNLPQTREHKPSRHDVEIGTWAERDRIGIWITDKRTDKTVAEWWDEDAREMFEQGFFKPGDIRHQTITGRAFEESVLDYAESMGILSGSGKYLAQTVRDAYYWTAVNKDTGEIVESHAPYTSSGRALRGGKAFASRHWRRGDTALVEVWRQPYRYSEGLKIQPVASEMVTPARSSAVIPTEPRRPRRKDELEFLPDSPEFLAYTIEDIGYRDKIDSAFQAAIARAKERR